MSFTFKHKKRGFEGAYCNHLPISPRRGYNSKQ